jgi:NAD-dependent deacetylase
MEFRILGPLEVVSEQTLLDLGAPRVRLLLALLLVRGGEVVSTDRLIEVHGSIDRSVCMECGGKVSLERVIELLRTADGAPLCEACVSPLKPDVVLFGELLPAAAMERATHLARSARLVLVVGSSLEVWPVAGLPLEARGFAIVNRGPTALDEHALLKVDAGAGETLRAVLDCL